MDCTSTVLIVYLLQPRWEQEAERGIIRLKSCLIKLYDYSLRALCLHYVWGRFTLQMAVPRMAGRGSLPLFPSSMYPDPADGGVVRQPKLSNKWLGEALLCLLAPPLFPVRRPSRRAVSALCVFIRGLQTCWRSQEWKFPVDYFLWHQNSQQFWGNL